MKLIVTGGAGFIGSAFVRLAANRELDVAIVDKLNYAGDLQRLKEVFGKIRFYNVDITDERNLEEVFIKERPELIIHFAAETHVDRSIINPKDFVFSNVLGTANLLELSLKYEVQRFIHISTDEVYGEISPNKNIKFRETDLLLPNSPYSASKASADAFVRAFYGTYGLPVVIIRPSNNYGPWQYPEKLISLTIAKVLLNEKMPIYGRGENIRTWLFVEDCVEAVLSVIEKGKVGEIYNVGSEEERKNTDVVKRILQIMGGDEDLIEFVADRPGHDFRYALDTTKIKNQTGWEPKVSFEEGLEGTIKWYMENKEWVLKKKSQVEEFVQLIRYRYEKIKR
jgi:dTDP-glucose 4,6-dehydratase